MSISDPLIKELKVLEAIFRKGLNHTVHSAFGLTRRDYWSWVEKTAQVSAGLDTNYKRLVEAVGSSPSVCTPQGRGRLFIRHALTNKCLHVPVETMGPSPYQRGVEDAFQWVPSHAGIPGNEVADSAARMALTDVNTTPFPLPLSAAKRLIPRVCRSTWNNTLGDALRITSMGQYRSDSSPQP
ncbi:hypothetical protein GWK47_047210 [Chionoecetes opilio]|uniref:RUN domain-containing protein n=1 Tax=Chionoecetes opilio TaxID=41210 RepID=A0A8J4Y6H7_CHIOP|nr:hypothetical protein GWK47_047210 [Chionoecetes opilio]